MVIFGKETNRFNKLAEGLDEIGVRTGYVETDDVIDVDTIEFEYDGITWVIEDGAIGKALLLIGGKVVKKMLMDEDFAPYLKRRSENLRKRHRKVYRRYIAKVSAKWGN